MDVGRLEEVILWQIEAANEHHAFRCVKERAQGRLRREGIIRVLVHPPSASRRSRPDVLRHPMEQDFELARRIGHRARLEFVQDLGQPRGGRQTDDVRRAYALLNPGNEPRTQRIRQGLTPPQAVKVVPEVRRSSV